jgi:DNA-binding MarR family transcriptional regulator
MYSPMPCEAPVKMALRGSITLLSVVSQDSLIARSSCAKTIYRTEHSLRKQKRTERIGQLLVVAAGAAQSLATERLEPLGLSPRAWGVLSTLIESGPLTQIELASATATDRTAMTYLLDELEQRALIKRVRNPDDRRSYLIHLTPEGKRTQARAAGDLAKQADTLLKPLSAAERSQLIDLLTRVADHWEELEAGSADAEGARPARALQALQNLADATNH